VTRAHIATALLCLTSLLPACTFDRNDRALSVGFIDNSRFDYVDGCGCTFWPPGTERSAEQRQLLLAATNERAWVNIEGELIELVKTYDDVRLQGRIGDIYRQRYDAPDTSVVVTCRATGFGDTHAVDCDASIAVTKNACTTTLAARGSCGC
jgi:hypothetical protein